MDRQSQRTDGPRGPFVLATVIRSEGSTPRGVGTRMIITADNEIKTPWIPTYYFLYPLAMLCARD